MDWHAAKHTATISPPESGVQICSLVTGLQCVPLILRFRYMGSELGASTLPYEFISPLWPLPRCSHRILSIGDTVATTWVQFALVLLFCTSKFILQISFLQVSGLCGKAVLSTLLLVYWLCPSSSLLKYIDSQYYIFWPVTSSNIFQYHSHP